MWIVLWNGKSTGEAQRSIKLVLIKRSDLIKNKTIRVVSNSSFLDIRNPSLVQVKQYKRILSYIRVVARADGHLQQCGLPVPARGGIWPKCHDPRAQPVGCPPGKEVRPSGPSWAWRSSCGPSWFLQMVSVRLEFMGQLIRGLLLFLLFRYHKRGQLPRAFWCLLLFLGLFCAVACGLRGFAPVRLRSEGRHC